MAVSLVLVRSDKTQVDVPLKHSTEVIGRHTDCKIRIPDSSVSRQHCELTIADGKIHLRDLGSSNGTFVNRRRISQTELSPGDVISVGKFHFVVRLDGRPAEIDADEVLADGEVVSAGAHKSSRASSPSSATRPAQQGAAKKGSSAANLDDELDGKLGGDADDSSIMDFDFLDDDEDQPKL